ncbi:MAG: hypothetical protein RIQ56_410, partial [Candidatus Parcubacteria bacterium]
VGEIATLSYEIQKKGIPVKTLEPYLSAPLHASVVSDDLSTFLHVHGEVHEAGRPSPKLTIRNGTLIHSGAHAPTPLQFGPGIEAHLVFPKAGFYTVWAQFKDGGEVWAVAHTVQVE